MRTLETNESQKLCTINKWSQGIEDVSIIAEMYTNSTFY